MLTARMPKKHASPIDSDTHSSGVLGKLLPPAVGTAHLITGAF